MLEEVRDFVLSLRADCTDWCYKLCDVFPSAEVKQAAFRRGRSECGSFLRRLPPEIACSKSASLSVEGEFVHLVRSFIRSLKTESMNGSIPVPDPSHACCHVQVQVVNSSVFSLIGVEDNNHN